jgi:DNA-binding XRE family transcriptional regulator
MIYFIRHTDFVKIGYTKDIFQRLPQLQTSCPVRLQVLGLINGSIEDEAIYHNKFKHLNSYGEWFKYCKELQDFIEILDDELMWKNGFLVNDNSVIGLIKSCRLKENLSLDELGTLLNVSKQAVLDMERREIQGSISIKSIIKALDKMNYKFECRAIKT